MVIGTTYTLIGDQPTNYMRYRLPGGQYAARVHLDRAPAQEWKELCDLYVPRNLNEHRQYHTAGNDRLGCC